MGLHALFSRTWNLWVRTYHPSVLRARIRVGAPVRASIEVGRGGGAPLPIADVGHDVGGASSFETRNVGSDRAADNNSAHQEREIDTNASVQERREQQRKQNAACDSWVTTSNVFEDMVLLRRTLMPMQVLMDCFLDKGGEAGDEYRQMEFSTADPSAPQARTMEYRNHALGRWYGYQS